MKRFLLLTLAASLAGVGPVAAETSQERGKHVVDQALQAMGGEHYLAMQDRVETGRAYSFYREQLSGLSLAKVYTRYLTRPEPPVPGFLGVREREAFGKNEDDAIVFNELGGWELTWRGARPMTDEAIQRFKDSTLHNVFYILRQRLGEPGLVMESRGSDIYDNQPVDIIDIIDADNRTTTVYFSQDTHLPVRQMYVRRDPKTRDRIEEETLYSKYRDVGGGVQWPFTIRRARNGEKLFEIYSDSVVINQNLTDNLFTLPANMKILKKDK